MDKQTLFDLIIKLKEQLRDLCFRYYSGFELFSWVWWILIVLIVIPFIVWWKLVDKKRLLEISMFGLLVALFATFFDVLGSDYVIWKYTVHVLPMSAVLIPVDFVVLPAIQTYVYQKCPKWGKYLLFSAITAAAQSFIAEPLAILIGQYDLYHWSVLYSFPIYLVMDVTVKFVVGRFKKRQGNENLQKP